MMRNKKAFTIVELVIVIAVIAILAAVLIPTFSGIIKKARISNDTNIAASVSTELLIFTEAGTIKDDVALLSALSKLENREEKLTPQSAKWGYHFWYDMENQKVVVKTVEEVAEMAGATPALLADEGASANTSFRDVFGIGYYLITDKIFNDVFGMQVFLYIDKLQTAEEYADLRQKLAELGVDEDNDGILANALLAKLKSTTIRTEAGAFFTSDEGAKNEYISPSATFLGDRYYEHTGTTVAKKENAPEPAGSVVIPSNIEYVPENALNYPANTNAEIIVPSVDRVVEIFSPSATNAIIKIGDEEYKIEGNELKTNTDEATTEAILSVKLPFEDFVIGFDKVEGVASASDKIYVAYKNGKIQLNATNANNPAQTSYAVETWQVPDGFAISGTGLIDFDDIPDFDGSVCEFKVTATANNVNGEALTREVTVVIVKPESATLKLITPNGEKLFILNGGQSSTDLLFNGELTSYELVVSEKYPATADGVDTNALLGNLKPIITVEENATRFFYSTTENKLIFKAEDKDGDNVYDDGTYSFKLIVDGCLETTVTATMENTEAAIFKTNFRHERTANRLYYIGSGNAVKLSDIFNVGTRFTSGMTAKLGIYDFTDSSGKLYPMYLANNDSDDDKKEYLSTWIAESDEFVENEDFADEDYLSTYVITPDNFDNIYIKFDFEETNVKTLDAYIEILPSNGTVSTVIKFEVVDGAVNVTDAAGLNAPTTSLVLQKDIKSVGNDVKVTLGANSLYGNGYVISALTYKSNKTDKTDLTDSFISVSTGTIDNVYIDGPVYPTLDYSNNNNGYYVSGIKITDAATVQHSYIKGFRQPVQVNLTDAGKKASFINTTLRGGNYANMTLASGSLYLKDVTTIQDQNGMNSTVDDTTKSVIGLGIVLDRSALANHIDIVIDGYLDQYNWVSSGVSKNADVDMPVIDYNGKSLDTKTFFGYMFYGYKDKVDMGRFKHLINQEQSQDPSSRSEGYINAGIAYAELGDAAEAVAIDLKITATNRDSSAYMNERTFAAAVDTKFSDSLVTSEGTLASLIKLALKAFKVNSIKDIVGSSGRLVWWSYADGRGWARGTSFSEVLLVKPSGTATYELSIPESYEDTTANPIIYRGYYDNYGAYSKEYVASANSDNILTKSN